jgi:hypothetical protein
MKRKTYTECHREITESHREKTLKTNSFYGKVTESHWEKNLCATQCLLCASLCNLKILRKPLLFITVNSQITQHLLDPEQLVILADPVGPAARSGLDLSGVGCHSNISNCRIFSLT